MTNSELKTLKDCKIDNDDKCYIGQVHQEAIKWAKHYRFEAEAEYLPREDAIEYSAKADSLIEFCNITEEEMSQSSPLTKEGGK